MALVWVKGPSFWNPSSELLLLRVKYAASKKALKAVYDVGPVSFYSPLCLDTSHTDLHTTKYPATSGPLHVHFLLPGILLSKTPAKFFFLILFKCYHIRDHSHVKPLLCGMLCLSYADSFFFLLFIIS